jgi:hypothetical protein
MDLLYICVALFLDFVVDILFHDWLTIGSLFVWLVAGADLF